MVLETARGSFLLAMAEKRVLASMSRAMVSLRRLQLVPKEVCFGIISVLDINYGCSEFMGSG